MKITVITGSARKNGGSARLAQIKRVIDRFYSINTQLTNKKMKAVLLSSQHDTGEKTVKSLQKHYSYILEWLNMENIGMVNAIGVLNGSDLENTEYLKQAYELGKLMK